MELSPSWEDANCAATPELPWILLNPKVHYRVHKSPPLVLILIQIDPVHIIPFYLRPILILFTHLRLGLPSGFLPSGFPTSILYGLLFPPSCYMPCTSHRPWLDHPIFILWRVQVMKLLITQFYSSLLSLRVPSLQISNSLLHITKQEALCKCVLRAVCSVHLAVTSERPLYKFEKHFGRITQRVIDTYSANPVTENY
jgi:hypothetical protein